MLVFMTITGIALSVYVVRCITKRLNLLGTRILVLEARLRSYKPTAAQVIMTDENLAATVDKYGIK